MLTFRHLLLLATVVMTMSTIAAAAEAPPASGEEIIVTAQKRAQTLIDVAQSVSVVSGAALEQSQAYSFHDYLKLVLGLQIEQSTPGQSRLVLRGLNTGGVASTVAVYVDETPFGSSTGLVNGGTLAGAFDTFDVARIEVLRRALAWALIAVYVLPLLTIGVWRLTHRPRRLEVIA